MTFSAEISPSQTRLKLGISGGNIRGERWGGPKRENRREGDGTSKCYRWLAKDDLMTKTGYGYAKCLTVAGTATALLCEALVWRMKVRGEWQRQGLAGPDQNLPGTSSPAKFGIF